MSSTLSELGRQKREQVDYFLDIEGISGSVALVKKLADTPSFHGLSKRQITSWVSDYLYRVRNVSRTFSHEDRNSTERRKEIQERKGFIRQCVADGDDTPAKIRKRIRSDNHPAFQRLTEISQVAVISKYLNEHLRELRTQEGRQETRRVQHTESVQKNRISATFALLMRDIEARVNGLIPSLEDVIKSSFASLVEVVARVTTMEHECAALQGAEEREKEALLEVGEKEMRLQRLRREVTNLDAELKEYRAHVCPVLDNEETERLRAQLGEIVAENTKLREKIDALGRVHPISEGNHMATPAGGRQHCELD